MSIIAGSPACRRLREDLQLLAIPDNPTVPFERRFFPRNKLITLFTRVRVEGVLLCQCLSCTSRIQHPKGSHRPGLCDTILGRAHSLQTTAILLFALLVFIECPQLISGFLEASCSDAVFEKELSSFTEDRVRRQYWPIYDEAQPNSSRRLAEQFTLHKYKFAIPCLTDQTFAIFDESTILPFFNEKWLGKRTSCGEVEQEGAYGRVFSFEILNEYRDFKSATDIQRFARKELRGLFSGRFGEERNNLERVKQLKDPHIVKIITAYKHGDSFNLVFPLARTNLGQYIRDVSFQAAGTSTDQLELHPFWEQMLGIARALTRILAGVLDSTGENILCGYHFDLKPANILVEDTDEGINFLISDFGQSMFREIVNGDNTSKVTGVGGSEAYAPPEIDIPDSKRNRKYDVWSLGCIILEIASFVVGGCEAVQRLDEIRFSECPQTGFLDDRFFQRASDPNISDYELKPQILDWMNDLPTFQTVHAARTEEFLRRILALVKQMLLVDVAKRLDAKFAYLTFSDILQEFQPPSSSKIESLTRDLDLPPDEVELGPMILAETQPISCSAMGRWYEGKASIVENSRGVLAILTSNRNDLERLNIGARATTTIVPYNIQPSPRVEGIPEHKRTVTLLHDSGHPMPKIFELHMHSLRDTVMIQSVLLGQSIRRLGTNASWSLPLRSASFDSRSTKMKKAVHSSKNINVLATVGRALAVQLWSEESHKDPNAWKFRRRKDSPRTIREYYFQGASPRRIVVYYERSILILRLAKNVRVEKPQQNSKSTSLRIVPTDPAADPTFPGSLLVCAPADRSPSIPLDRRKLDAEEERKGFECRSLTLGFQTPDELYAFYKAYRSLKKEWLNEVHGIENFRERMGEELGWSLN